MGSDVVVRSVPGQRFAQEIEAGRHRLQGDEPERHGGADLGPDPYGYLLIALGTCMSMTLRMYAERKGFALRGVEVQVSHSRTYARDCEDCETKQGMVDEIRSRIRLDGDLDDAQRTRLLQIATRCPMHRTLSSEIKIRTTEV